MKNFHEGLGMPWDVTNVEKRCWDFLGPRAAVPRDELLEFLGPQGLELRHDLWWPLCLNAVHILYIKWTQLVDTSDINKKKSNQTLAKAQIEAFEVTPLEEHGVKLQLVTSKADVGRPWRGILHAVLAWSDDMKWYQMCFPVCWCFSLLDGLAAIEIAFCRVINRMRVQLLRYSMFFDVLPCSWIEVAGPRDKACDPGSPAAPQRARLSRENGGLTQHSRLMPHNRSHNPCISMQIKRIGADRSCQRSEYIGIQVPMYEILDLHGSSWKTFLWQGPSSPFGTSWPDCAPTSKFASEKAKADDLVFD